ncbi:hypothetical protein [Numidum massiliense]|uniref:hypothetical protein n=1 Tax=Numidum massiliense TaxID=1522315 RepID=UPI0006D56FC1|nr:hypothetical protein [Numidum massiliense]
MYHFKTKDELAAFVASEVVNSSEATQILECTRQNLTDMVKRGKLAPIKELPRDRWFFKDDVIQRKKEVTAWFKKDR